MEAEPLAGHDAEQVALMAEECILVDARAAVLEKTVDGLRARFGDAAPVKGRGLAPKRK